MTAITHNCDSFSCWSQIFHILPSICKGFILPLQIRFFERVFWVCKKFLVANRHFSDGVEILFDKYRDISASSTLNPGTKSCFLNIFCGVTHNMCNTKVKDITWNILFNWWKNLKLVQHANFNIPFAKWSFAWTCTTTLSSWVHELRSDKTLFNSQKEIKDQTKKLDELKDKQKQYIKIKRRKSILDGFSLISKDFV